MKVIPASELESHIGEEVGVSDWFEVTQERINQFAEATNDHQFIPVSYTHLTLPTNDQV